MAESRNSVEIFWSDEDEGYIAIVPGFTGCSAFGKTRAEAATEIEDAITSWRLAYVAKYADPDEEFFAGLQWTADEIAKMNRPEPGQPFVFNKIPHQA